MATKRSSERAASLREAITKYRELYHIKDESPISQGALDALKYELVKLEEKYPELVTPNSPTQVVAGKPLPELKKARHIVPQWSFNDAFIEEDVRAFAERVKKLTGKTPTYDLELKIDGLKIVYTYEKGKLVVAATRGDGRVGEDVTHNIRTIRSIPQTLSRPIDCVVEGEVYLTRSGLEKLNAIRKAKGESEFANPRNAAAGSIRQLDPSVAAARPLAAFIYDLAQSSEPLPPTQTGELEYLKELGFAVNLHHEHADTLEKVFEYWKRWQAEGAREKLDYQLDGVVIKIEDRGMQEMLGYTGKAPRYSIAYKFPPEQVETILEDITLQVGRTGVLTPVAHVRPVAVAGTVVARATLHNEDFITEKDIRVGDTVILQKAGDIIPEIVSVIKELRSKNAKEWKFPTRSDLCGGDGSVERIPGQAAWRCVAQGSFEQQARKLMHFAGRSALNIDGLGRETVKLLMEHELASEFHDFFDLTKDELLTLPGFEELKAQNLLDGIAMAKKVELYRLIIGLSIPHVGEENAYLLAMKFGTLKKLARTSSEELGRVEGVGPIIGTAVADWFSSKNNKAMLGRLLKHLKIQKVIPPKAGPLTGQTVVVTGTLPTLSREEAEALVRAAGGKVASSISKNTSFVLAGENPGSKYDKARELGISILDEATFLKKLSA